MIRTGRPDRTEPKGPVERPLTCWGESPVCDAVAFEPADGRVFVFPKGHLACAEYSGPAPLETMRLTFSTHEVRLSGHGLRALVMALQAGTVSWVKCFSAALGPLRGRDAGWIVGLEISRVDLAPDSGRPGEGAESGGGSPGESPYR
jgi:hypothetical protein